MFCQPTKAHKARFGEGPEAFNVINYSAYWQFIVAMLHSEVLNTPSRPEHHSRASRQSG